MLSKICGPRYDLVLTRLFYVLLGLILAGCGHLPSVKLVVSNPSEDQLTNKLVVLKRDMLSKVASSEHLKITLNGKEIPFQVDDLNGDSSWDELVFVSSFEPNETKVISVSESDRPQEFEVYTSLQMGLKSSSKDVEELDSAIRLTTLLGSVTTKTYQMEGIAWENDKIAFRNYLDQRNAMDIFGKKVTKMVMDESGINGQHYHEMDYWGMDILKVGNTVGAGGIGIVSHDSAYRVGTNGINHYRKVIEGPIRSIFDLVFKRSSIGQKEFDLTHRIEIIKGMNGYRSEIFTSLDDSLGLVVGLVKKPKASYQEKNYTEFVTTGLYGDYSLDSANLGMGLIIDATYFRKARPEVTNGEIENSHLIQLNLVDGQSNYAFIGAWQTGNSAISNTESFNKLMVNEAKNYLSELTINVAFY